MTKGQAALQTFLVGTVLMFVLTGIMALAFRDCVAGLFLLLNPYAWYGVVACTFIPLMCDENEYDDEDD